MASANMYKFLKFLILIRLLPLSRADAADRTWRLSLLCPGFLLLMAAFLVGCPVKFRLSLNEV